MADPSSQVAQPLLGHLHCLSKMPYPPITNLAVDIVGDLLLKAPAATQQFPFHWSMLDTPIDGSLFLVWVPPLLSTACASDGFVWADPDQGYSMELPKGYTIEMVQTKSGFIPGQETHTLHTRRRYRLVSGPKNPNAAPFDPSLWIFHYMRADRAHQIPVASIPLGNANITQIQTTRRHINSLQQQGLISQKEFMLHDRNSWPSVTFGITSQMPPKPQANPRGAMGAQTRGYPTPPQAQPNKRQKLPQGAPQPGPSNMPHQVPPTPASIAAGHHDPPITIDEEEDTSRGDVLDHISPREISQARYTQHHEWMEEVLGSVYPISQIRPVDLGLGLRGELEEMTKGLLEPPTFPPTNSTRRPPASRAPGEAGGIENTEDSEAVADDEDDGHMDPAIVQELAKRAHAKTREIEEEMERMKVVHQQRLAKVQKTGIIKEAEQKLRANINFNLFGIVDPSVAEETVSSPSGPNSNNGDDSQPSPVTGGITDDELIAMVEDALGKKIVPREMVIRWDLSTGKEIVGNVDLVQDADRDEEMGNTGAEGDAANGSIEQSPKQEDPPTNNSADGNNDNDAPQSSSEIDDVNMDNDDTLMDEPSNFADAFDSRDMEDPDESSTSATPHLVLPPSHHVGTGGGGGGGSGASPSIGITSPSPQPSALTPNSAAVATTTATATATSPGLPAPSPTPTTSGAIGSPLFGDQKIASPGNNNNNSSPAIPVPDTTTPTVPSSNTGVTYSGIPGLGGDQGVV